MNEARSPNEIDKFAGQKILAARYEKGISQEKLAEGIGVTFQQLQKYENGKNRISLSRLYLIADFLNLPYDYFFPARSGRPRNTLDTGCVLKQKKRMYAALRKINKIAASFK